MGQRRLSGLHGESRGFDSPKRATIGQQVYCAMTWVVYGVWRRAITGSKDRSLKRRHGEAPILSASHRNLVDQATMQLPVFL